MIKKILYLHILLACGISSAFANTEVDSQVEWYASTEQISIQEAQKRLTMMDNASSLSALLKAEHSGYVDAYIENEPQFKVVFTYKKDSPLSEIEKLKDLAKGFDLEASLTVQYVERSSEDLQKIQTAILDVLEESNIDRLKVYIDPIKNAVIADVFPEDKSLLTMNIAKRYKGNIPAGLVIGELTEIPSFVGKRNTTKEH